MKTAIKFDAIKSMPRDQQLKTLAGAIANEFEKPMQIVEAIGAHAISNAKMTAQQAANQPVFERIKSFLALKYATTSDNPNLNDVANQYEQFFHSNMPAMDLAFTQIFDLVDLRGSTHDHFDILDTNAGISWAQRQPGEPVKIRRAFTESKTTVAFLEFAEGLGILDAWLDFQQFWNIDEAAAEFRQKYYDKMASQHYGLLTALSSAIDTAFSIDDTTTFNAAAATIVRNCAGLGVGQNAQFYIVCAPEKLGRLERMLTAQRGSPIVDFGTMKEPIGYGVKGIISTPYVPAADTGYYLVLPGRKLKRGVWKDLTVKPVRNEYVSATDIIGVGRYNAAVGDSNQVRRVKYA